MEQTDDLCARARALSENGAFAEAMEAWNRVLAVQSDDAEAQFWKGHALLMLGYGEEAENILANLLIDRPDYPNARWLYAGTLLKRYGAYEPHVLDAYDRALAADSENGYLQVERADVLREVGRYDEACAVYAELADPGRCPDENLRIEAAFKWGCAALVLEDRETARRAFRYVLDIAPDYPDAREMLALTF